ncbi:MAG: methylenetetrahydrofolate dehydrogenase / methenyltetrahydrofolate cyclohydrolase [Thermoplasmata archaeon]|jgi:methylenetetrahydrofolate dehydrogenase (NADP+)/methenyltetrahydrofolate cyclohydrolase|nr:methylenetetrahydrofolate dehydrogenase / methenyltetrahydrofolate cyclohydrolase [Thermoplasmata archaeon]
MSARILDGKAIAAEIRADIARRVKAAGRQPGLAVILVGDDPASHTYVNSKEKAAKECGFLSIVERYPADVTEAALLSRVEAMNRDPRVHGFFVQFPVPRQIDGEKVMRAVSPDKDVDGFHPLNQGLLLQGQPRFLSATPRGVVELIMRAGGAAGKRVVILGRSNTVGKPLAAALMSKGPRADATVTVAHSRTPDLAKLCREADVLVAAMGQPRLVRGDWIKPGATVIDVGTSRVEGKLVGDVDFDAAKEVAGWITPVPGGVGPMTIAMLMLNTLEAAGIP